MSISLILFWWDLKTTFHLPDSLSSIIFKPKGEWREEHSFFLCWNGSLGWVGNGLPVVSMSLLMGTWLGFQHLWAGLYWGRKGRCKQPVGCASLRDSYIKAGRPPSRRCLMLTGLFSPWGKWQRGADNLSRMKRGLNVTRTRDVSLWDFFSHTS